MAVALEHESSIAKDFRNVSIAKQARERKQGLGYLLTNNNPSESQAIYLQTIAHYPGDNIRLETAVSNYVIESYGQKRRKDGRFTSQHAIEGANLLIGNSIARVIFLAHDLVEDLEGEGVTRESIIFRLHNQEGYPLEIVSPIADMSELMNHKREALKDDKNRKQFFQELLRMHAEHPEYQISQIEILDPGHNLLSDVNRIIHGNREQREAGRINALSYMPSANSKLDTFGPYEKTGAAPQLNEIILFAKDETRKLKTIFSLLPMSQRYPKNSSGPSFFQRLPRFRDRRA